MKSESDLTSSDENNSDSNELIHESQASSKQRYGCFNFSPNWLQVFNNRLWLAFLIGVHQLFYGFITTGYDSSIISTLQKGFGLNSADIGGTTVCYSIAQSVLGIIISHKASVSHKGKWLGLTGIITAIGCVIYVLPHFIIPTYITLTSYKRYSNQSDLCVAHNRSYPDLCYVENTGKGLYIFIFCLGQFVLGTGTSIIGSVGWSYLDENVSPRISPVYNGIILCLLGLSTAMGFAFGATALDLYVYWPSKAPAPDLTPENPNWVGAWWFGYIFAAIIVMLASLPMFAFPRHLPNYEHYKKQREELAVGKSKNDQNYGHTMKEIIPAVKELLCNLPFMCTTLSLVGYLLVLSAMGTFLPKYMEAQFGLIASTASMYAGFIVVAGMLLGLILVGIFMKRVELGLLRMAKYTWIASLFCILTAVTFIITKCPNTPIAGVNVPYNNDSFRLSNGPFNDNLTSDCNIDCHCTGDNFKPVCDESTGITYFSPCRAGCSSVNKSINSHQGYSNCSCFNFGTPMNNQDQYSRKAALNYCPKKCGGLIPFLILGTVFALSVFCTLIPSIQIIFRCVPESQLSLALAIERAIVLLLGTTPGPIIMGVFIDSACTLWKEECGVKKFCWIYDGHTLAFAMTGMLLAMKIFSSLFAFLAYYFLKRDIQKYSNTEEQVTINKNLSNSDDPLFNESPLLQHDKAAVNNNLETSEQVKVDLII